MSIALSLLFGTSPALMAVHGDALTLQPGQTAVVGYAEELEADPEARGGKRGTNLHLHVADDLVTHIVHVPREQLGAVDLKKVNMILRSDSSGKRYRVRHYTDDPGRPETDFYCSLA